MNDVINVITKDRINVELFTNKGLITANELNDRFYTLYKNYKILLEKYLLHKCSLKQYDDKIDNSGLYFIPEQSRFMDIYQSISSMGLKYIYLRNDLSVEKLSIEDINLLVNLSVQDLLNPNNDLFNLIEVTYKNVINSKPDNLENSYFICYGPDIDDFWIKSDELVFGFRFDEIADNGLGDGIEWKENNFKQIDFLNELFDEMTVNFSNILGIKVNFIHYNDFTVANSLKR